MSKEAFKSFVRQHPYLTDSVYQHRTTWQELYELYDIYGNDEQIFKKYQLPKEDTTTKTKNQFAFNELISMIQNVDLETVQKGVNGLQKAIGLLQEIAPDKDKTITPQYEERPLYKYYED